tara:strand:- start:700 stop:1446 length:747 start_codon:yes stop_codon:yes gene_type:complete
MNNTKNNQNGFSLVELAMVLFIVSLMIGGLLVPLATSVEQAEREDTQRQLDDVKEALYAFGVVNGRLPCPDCTSTSVTGCGSVTPNDGVEDQTASSPFLDCASLFGNLPWTTLGVDENDAWGQHFTYRVTQAFAYEVANTTAVTAPCNDSADAAFDLCTPGDIDVSETEDDGTPTVADNVAAIAISHGMDYSEPTHSALQLDNTDTDFTFVKKDFSRDYSGGTDFDDLMIWISPSILKNNLVNAGKLP